MERIIQLVKAKREGLSIHEDTIFYLVRLVSGNFAEILQDVQVARGHRRGMLVYTKDLNIVLNKIWGLKISTGYSDKVEIDCKKRKLESMIKKKRTKRYIERSSTVEDSITCIEGGSDNCDKEWIHDVEELVSNLIKEYVRKEDSEEIENILYECYTGLLNRYIDGMYKMIYSSFGLYDYLGLEEEEPVGDILLPCHLLDYMKSAKVHKTSTWSDVLSRIKLRLNY